MSDSRGFLYSFKMAERRHISCLIYITYAQKNPWQTLYFRSHTNPSIIFNFGQGSGFYYVACLSWKLSCRQCRLWTLGDLPFSASCVLGIRRYSWYQALSSTLMKWLINVWICLPIPTSPMTESHRGWEGNTKIHRKVPVRVHDVLIYIFN